MKLRFLPIAIFVAVLGTQAVAQDKYEEFVGHWVAAVEIANACNGFTVANQQSAADIAKTQNGLRRQKVLRLLYYGKRDALTAVGAQALKERGLDKSNAQGLCKFGRTVAEQNDSIGRFLRVK